MSDLATKSFTARLRFATVKTDDVARSARFYEEVLGFPRTRTAEDFVQLDAGGAELCIDLDDGGPHQPRLIFAVDDRDAICASVLLTATPDTLVISTQVMQEFYVTVTCKLRRPLPAQRAASAVRAMAKLDVVQVDVPLVFTAMDTSQEATISLWDALMIEAARQARCRRILTEDLPHGQVIRDVAVENPFQPDVAGQRTTL